MIALVMWPVGACIAVGMAVAGSQVKKRARRKAEWQQRQAQWLAARHTEDLNDRFRDRMDEEVRGRFDAQNNWRFR